MPENILKQLKTECSFSEVFQDTEKAADSISDVPRRKIGHIRADHDGYRWWNSTWPYHRELATPEITAEIDEVYNALTASDALSDFDTLVHFCEKHPEARVHPTENQEYNFYLGGYALQLLDTPDHQMERLQYVSTCVCKGLIHPF